MLDEIKFKFLKGDTLIRVIIINLFVFIPLMLFNVVSIISDNKIVFDNAMSYIGVPSIFSIAILRPWTLFTYSIVHFDLFHFVFNMIGLYWLGGIIQEYLGNKRFVNLYILGGLAGAALYLLCYATIPYFGNQPGKLVGASASIFAMAVAAVTLLPHIRIYMVFLGEVRLIYIVGFYLLVSFASIIGNNPGGNLAHLGGGILGYAYIKLLKNGYDLGYPIQKIWDFISNLFKKKSNMKVSYKNSNKFTEEPDQDEIDRILDKMNQKGGYNALSQEEKEKLFKYSQK
jgi:membrane associated rhomboid family serine protease